ncbi:hypothetical protein RIF29_23746 [Crotalaria pallida]|uniref:Uncharacterized protein n=1 Tax=Crotalaria pallida TaxID=3830 RepID=A0AAN9I8R9_CROPI
MPQRNTDLDVQKLKEEVYYWKRKYKKLAMKTKEEVDFSEIAVLEAERNHEEKIEALLKAQAAQAVEETSQLKALLEAQSAQAVEETSRLKALLEAQSAQAVEETSRLKALLEAQSAQASNKALS